MRSALLLATTIAAVCAGASHAADVPISGRRLLLQRTSGGKRVTLTSRFVGLPLPAPGSADDPRTGGVTIEVFSSGEGPATLAIPAGATGWTVSGSGGSLAYKFVNKTAPGGTSPVRILQMKAGRGLKLQARDLSLPLDVAQGPVGVRITLGGTRLCALFVASTIRRDVPGKYLAADAPIGSLTNCLASSLGAPAVCGNGETDPGEDCDGAPGVCVQLGGAACGAPGSTAECQCCATAVNFCGVQGQQFAPCCDPAAVCTVISAPSFPMTCQIPPVPTSS